MKSGKGREERKERKLEQRGKELFIQRRVYSTLCSERRTRTMARVNVPSWKQGNNDVHVERNEEGQWKETERGRDMS